MSELSQYCTSMDFSPLSSVWVQRWESVFGSLSPHLSSCCKYMATSTVPRACEAKAGGIGSGIMQYVTYSSAWLSIPLPLQRLDTLVVLT